VNLILNLLRRLNQGVVLMRQLNLMVVPKKEVKPEADLMKRLRR